MREFLRSKIHNAVVTKADLDYEGSIGIDAALLDGAAIKPYESVEVYNISNGERLRTYAIELPSGSGRIESNGAAAHLIRCGDRVIIAAYSWISETEIEHHKPKVLILGPDNSIKNQFEGATQLSSTQAGGL